MTPTISDGTASSRRPAWRLPPAWRMALFFAATFAVTGVHLPFWPVWLAAQDQSPAAIGLLLAVGVWVRIVSNPLIADLADRSGQRRRPMLWLAWGSLGVFSLFAVATGFPQLLLVSLLFGCLWAPLIPLGDDLALLIAYAEGRDYGRIRVWGSISFIVTASLAGWLLAGSGATGILWLLLGLLLANALVCRLLPDRRVTKPDRTLGLPLRQLLRQRDYALFVLAAGLLQASHAVYYGFGSLHWRSAGLGDRLIGLLWSEGVLAEILLFAFSAGILRRIGPLNLLLLGAGGGIVRWTLTAATSDPLALVGLQLLHGLTFGAAHLGAMHYMARAVPPGLTASAQSLYSALTGGIFLGGALILSGPLYAHAGGAAFLAMAAMSLAGGLAVLVLIRRANSAKSCG